MASNWLKKDIGYEVTAALTFAFANDAPPPLKDMLFACIRTAAAAEPWTYPTSMGDRPLDIVLQEDKVERVDGHLFVTVTFPVRGGLGQEKLNAFAANVAQITNTLLLSKSLPGLIAMGSELRLCSAFVVTHLKQDGTVYECITGRTPRMLLNSVALGTGEVEFG